MKNNGIHAGAEGIDRVFRAIGDPHRIRIIGLLREKELSAGEILQSTDVVQSTLSHHMKTLTDSGAVNAVRRGKCTCYSLNGETFARLGAFFEDCAKGTSVMKADRISRDAAGSGRAKAPAEDAVKEPAETASGKTAKSVPGEAAGSAQMRTAAQKADGKASEKAGKKKDKKNKKGKKNKNRQ